MNKKILVFVSLLFVMALVVGATSLVNKNSSKEDKKTLFGTVMTCDDSKVTIQDPNYIIYTFDVANDSLDVGDSITIEYTGVLDKNTSNQNCKVITYSEAMEGTDEIGIPSSWSENGIFSNYYKQAYNKLKKLSLDEKIGQLLLVRYPDENQDEVVKKYNVGGVVFYEKDFRNKTESEVKLMINKLQNESNIPLLTAVDEEGGSIVRVSSNPALVSEKFKSPSDLYTLGGFNKIKEDTIDKSRILYNLGLNLNLAPVVDVSTNERDYIHERTLKQDTDLTSTYAKTVIESSKGTGVSYTLKHFPGYSGNADTHIGSSIDNRSYDDILNNDLPPFKAGIDVGAEAVLVSHNTVNGIDNSNPASLSASVHNLLRNKLGFTGISIADDIGMGAVNSIEDVTVKALLAGNDIIITTDYEKSFNSIKDAIKNQTLSEEQIDKLAFRVLAWKYYKLLLVDYEK